MKRLICTVLVCAALLSLLSACGSASEDLMKDIVPAESAADGEYADCADAAAEFALRAFEKSLGTGEGETLISPLSLLSALAMTANGAEGETLAQMEQVLGAPMADLNHWLRDYAAALPQSKEAKLHTANGIWLRDCDGLKVERDFLQTNADFFGAEVSKAPFDSGTVRQINDFVDKNTDGMIKEIVSDFDPSVMLCLVNALGFDAQWQSTYTEGSVREGIFTAADGREQTADFMHCTVHEYLLTDKAQGFLKRYKGGDYAFAALLPDEGVSIEECVASLSGETLRKTMLERQDKEVRTSLPKFENEYFTDMSEVLSKLGMTDAFLPDRADFEAMAQYSGGGLFISSVLHKTKIQVFEQGTKAGAATAVAVTGAGMPVEEPKQVYLDRPFLYMIVDCSEFVPVFIGAVTQMN